MAQAIQRGRSAFRITEVTALDVRDGQSVLILQLLRDGATEAGIVAQAFHHGAGVVADGEIDGELVHTHAKRLNECSICLTSGESSRPDSVPVTKLLPLPTSLILSPILSHVSQISLHWRSQASCNAVSSA